MPKVVMAVSVAAMGMGLFGALQNEARATGGGGSYCQHNIDGDSGIGTYCSNNVCKDLTGQGSNAGPCGTW